MSFSFGNPASSSGGSGSLFGTANQNTSNTGSGGGLFGNVGASTSGTSSPSLFSGTTNAAQSPIFGGGAQSGASPLFGGGSAQSQSGTSPSLFGNAGQNQSGTSSLFGGANAQNKSGPSLFGSGSQTPNKPNETSAPGQSSGLFGKPAGGLFGNTTATPGTSGGSSLFGNTSTTPAGPPPQGSAAGQGQSLFGQAAQKPGGLFGGLNTTSSSTTPSTTAPASGSPSLFGSTPQQPSSGGLFGSTPQQKPTPTFGTTPSAPSGGGLFSNLGKDKPAESTTPATTTEGAAKPLFGTAPTPSTGGAQGTQTSSLFKTPATGTEPAAQPATTQPSTSTGTTQSSLFPSLGGTTSAAPSSTPAAAPSGTGLFGAPKSTATSAPSTTATSAPTTQPATAGGLFGKPAESTATSQPSMTATTTAGTTPATTTTSGTTTSTATATAGATTGTTGAGGPALGASTAGPPPTAQSRLKNKTMDEIITRWATDLTKYQKDFREQAETVAEWDRMLVENANKMQKLYGSTVDADRSTQEVERQLASVEAQQEELGSWLDRYEHEVDEMMSKQVGPGETLQGPDQERERTYKLAEKLSDRLDTMGKDLVNMIDEVNGASATLSKTHKADEPLSQIVRILNAHLSQLQLIDQGTSDLQAKVLAAQKAGQSLSSRFGNGLRSSGMDGSSAADDFYRSFMGRR